MRGRGTGAALATAEHVRADEEVAAGVERLARPDEVLPPAAGGMAGPRRSLDVGVAGQRMADQHRVRAVVVELSPRLVGERGLAQHAPTLEGEGTGLADGHEAPAPRRVARLPGARHRKAGSQRWPGEGTTLCVFGHPPRSSSCTPAPAGSPPIRPRPPPFRLLDSCHSGRSSWIRSGAARGRRRGSPAPAARRSGPRSGRAPTVVTAAPQAGGRPRATTARPISPRHGLGDLLL